jgi:hypothetical protein
MTQPAPDMTEREQFHVIERQGWSYVVGPPGTTVPDDFGPWRYRWEAQEYADKLNAKAKTE